ncbi:hypothetical protein [Bradyrhizobium prioriisuperbiae]|uniref:hypothetical protein n=1 Tax=Bradyrhizobium prioriisuperbiae TaxID=2854389 RepID=UPI0028E69340|nr:hypothetical protein [Bradyrhizobium prioritasuperba]
MTLHRFVLAARGLGLGLVVGLLFGLVPNPVSAAEAAKPPEPFSPTLIFYVAKGGPDACGQGCDTWIAAEGRIDSEAAARLRKFFRQHKDQKLPIYFHSPGGNVEQALAMGRMLRNDKAVVRVGRTLVKGCVSGLQIDDACLKLKQAGGQIDAEIATRGAMCNSACPFVLFGAITRGDRARRVACHSLSTPDIDVSARPTV